MAEAIIHTEGLIKDYGRFRALSGVDLSIERGEVFGFLGPNGSGKSTTIRVLLNLLKPTAGVARVFGQIPSEAGGALRSRIGYLPGELAMAGRRTAGDLLGYFAHLRGGAGRDRIEPLAERFGLQLDKPIRGLSKGNKQKVGVVQAFMHSPELLILDEPTSGLDPLLQREFLDLVKEARDGGATVFMSSHVLREVEAVADRVAIIRAGKVVDVDHISVMRHNAGQAVELQFEGPVAVEDFVGLPGVHDVTVEGSTMSCLLRGEPDALLKAAARHRVLRWRAEDREIDALFLDLYREDGAAPQKGGS